MTQFRTLFAITIGLLLGLTLTTRAQFEGSVTFTQYKVEASSGEQSNEGTFSLLLSPKRIMMTGLAESGRNLNVIGSGTTDGILIRLDKEDFIIMGDDSEALQLKKSDIQTMFGFIKSMQSSEAENLDKLTVETTDEVREIKGYEATKTIIRSTDQPNQRFELWSTDQIAVNWGMLAEEWVADGSEMLSVTMIYENVVRKRAFPLLIEEYSGERLNSFVEASNITQQKLPAAQLSIPSGLKVMTLQEMMMKGFSGN